MAIGDQLWCCYHGWCGRTVVLFVEAPFIESSMSMARFDLGNAGIEAMRKSNDWMIKHTLPSPFL